MIHELNSRIAAPAKRLAQRFGYDIVRRGHDDRPYADFGTVDIDKAVLDLFERIRPYTLTSIERLAALRQAVMYVVQAGIEGVILECGVWRGGSMLAVAHTLVALGVDDRDLYLFDTFDTMPPPGDKDVNLWGERASDIMEEYLADPYHDFIPEREVQALMIGTGYPKERIHFVKGMVEDTIPDRSPERIALCRLDTDWYVSTAHEMRHLFHRIPEGGVLIIDDYGHFEGCREAVDEYFERVGVSILLNRIDYTGRLAVVTREAHDRSAAYSSSAASSA